MNGSWEKPMLCANRVWPMIFCVVVNSRLVGIESIIVACIRKVLMAIVANTDGVFKRLAIGKEISSFKTKTAIHTHVILESVSLTVLDELLDV